MEGQAHTEVQTASSYLLPRECHSLVPTGSPQHVCLPWLTGLGHLPGSAREPRARARVPLSMLLPGAWPGSQTLPPDEQGTNSQL